MFCNQCEQTAQGVACTKIGVCGKTDQSASLQDLIIYATRGLSLVALRARAKGVIDPVMDKLTVEAIFSCVTNVNFDDEALTNMLNRVIAAKRGLVAKAGLALQEGPETFGEGKTAVQLLGDAELEGTNKLDSNADILSIRQTLLYGIKGLAAYTDHAAVLGHSSAEHYGTIHELMAAGYDGKGRDLGAWVQELLKCGNVNLKAMELLDAANTGTYGHPVPTPVPLAPKAGKAILVTGHDLKDLFELLVATEGKGINVYTHGEMLPAHGYPGLKKFKHFIGHFGTAWQNQVKELPNFPGPILFTTNCIQKPAENYKDRVFTTGLVGWPGVKHVKNGQFQAVIDMALAMPGFCAADEANGSKTRVLSGFGRNAVLSVADKVIDGVKSGAIKHFFLVGGCDGARPGRNYYTEFVEKAPKDTIILTLACGKFRFFDKDLGTIGGIPRLLDVGQCNDAYSAIKIAMALADAFKCGVNDLPLSLVLSWYEQKAVAILLTLLALGIKDIRLGPTLPAFVSPNVLKFLVENYDIKPITTPDEDLKAILRTN